MVPNFWDPGRRSDRPDLTRVGSIRFLTEEDYPPFNYKTADGQLVGFNVELARAICDELRVPCTIQMRRWDRLADALEQNQGDALIASLALSPDLRRRFEVSDRYLATPARFVTRRASLSGEATPEALRNRRIGVMQGTAHAAFLASHFKAAEIKTYESEALARNALKTGEVDAHFGDGIGLSFWLQGVASEDCCVFLGGPFQESRYFGEGMAILMRRGNQPLRAAINHALHRLWDRGVYTELYLRHFPMGIY